MVTFSHGIYILIARFMENYAKRNIVSMHKKDARFYPLIRQAWQARQMEIFSVMSDMIQMLDGLKKSNFCPHV